MSFTETPVKLLLAVVVIIIAAAAGMYLGGKLSESSGQSSANQLDIFTHLTLGPGIDFPDIQVTNDRYQPELTQSILNENGTVILFMDHQCPPCQDVAVFWQQLINNGDIASEQVIGICFEDAAHIHNIRNRYQVTFPIYADEEYTFLDNYGVDAFPLILIVGRSGVINYIETDSNKKIGKSELKKSLQS